jgi:hypothetical protein
VLICSRDGHATVKDNVSTAWCKPRGIRLTATSRYIRDKLFPR